MKKLISFILVLVICVIGICPTYAAMQAPATTDTDSSIMPLVNYEGPMTSYQEEINIGYGIFHGINIKFNNPKLTVSVGAVNADGAPVAAGYIIVHLNRYLPGGTFIEEASATIPVDGNPHNMMVGFNISPSYVYMFSYTLNTHVDADVDVVLFAHSYSYS